MIPKRLLAPLLAAAALAGCGPTVPGAAPPAASASAKAASSPAPASAATPGTGLFSANAVNLADAAVGKRALTIPSPDGRSSVQVDPVVAPFIDRLRLHLSGALGARDIDIPPGAAGELLWAPDSQAFFVTYNGGGLVGPYGLRVVGRYGGVLAEHDLTSLIQKRFGQPVRCFTPQAPNVGGLAWLGSSRKLMAVAQIAPNGACDSFGTFLAYEVDLAPPAIARPVAQSMAKGLHPAEVGSLLRATDDECERDPPVCYIPALHPGEPPHPRAPQ